MEEPKTAPEQPKQVMDIQRPQPAQPAQAATPPQQTEVVEPPALSADEQQPATEEPKTAEPLVAQPAAQPKRHGAPIGAIIVAVLVAVSLAVVSVAAYKKSELAKDTNNASPAAATTQTEAPAGAEPSDVDEVTKEIDTTMNELNAATDLNADDLSDEVLGL